MAEIQHSVSKERTMHTRSCCKCETYHHSYTRSPISAQSSNDQQNSLHDTKFGKTSTDFISYWIKTQAYQINTNTAAANAEFTITATHAHRSVHNNQTINNTHFLTPDSAEFSTNFISHWLKFQHSVRAERIRHTRSCC